MNELDSLRSNIDRIDKQIILLLAERKATVQSVSEYKIKNDIETFQPDRERELFERMDILADQNGLETQFVRQLFSLITQQSKKMQEDLKKDVRVC